MQQPTLIIVAGCNGAGKSTYSSSYVKDICPFDFDKRFLETYNSMFDSEFREDMARNKTIQEFENAIQFAFDNNQSFCYETNFDSNPVYWAKRAKELGYRLELHFYCLESIEMAKLRVEYRTLDNGHFVPYETIKYKWKQGYKNLNLHFSLFDYILLIDNSKEDSPPINIFEISKESDELATFALFVDELPEYAQRRFPEIFKLIQEE